MGLRARSSKAAIERQAPRVSEPKRRRASYSASKEYVVESIHGRKMVRGKVFYLVKWEGYPMKENTWEPLNNLDKTLDVILEYQKKQGATDRKERRNTPAKSQRGVGSVAAVKKERAAENKPEIKGVKVGNSVKKTRSLAVEAPKSETRSLRAQGRKLKTR